MRVKLYAALFIFFCTHTHTHISCTENMQNLHNYTCTHTYIHANTLVCDILQINKRELFSLFCCCFAPFSPPPSPSRASLPISIFFLSIVVQSRCICVYVWMFERMNECRALLNFRLRNLITHFLSLICWRTCFTHTHIHTYSAMWLQLLLILWLVSLLL